MSMIFLIREPSIKKHRPMPDGHIVDEPVDTHRSFWAKFKSLSKSAWHECKRRPKYIFCFICLLVSRLMNVLFAVYI